MRVLLSLLAICFATALPVLADEPSKPPAAEQRPPDAVDSVLLLNGEVVLGVVQFSEGGVTVRLPSGKERTIPRAEIRSVNRWAPAPVHAAVANAVPEAAASTETRSYGGQNLAADGVALGMGVASLIILGKSTNTPVIADVLGIASGATYLLASPIIHKLHHDDWTTSLESLGIRIAVPIAAGAVGYLLSLPAQQSCEAGPVSHDDLGCLDTAAGALLGGAIGMVAAVVIDDGFLAHETIATAPPRVSLAPLLLPRGSTVAPQGGTGMSFAARF